MSMDKAKLDKLKNKQAITCCRFEAGSTVDEKILEDPNLIPDFVDSGLLTIPDNILTIGQAMGGKLKVTVDALCPLTTDNVEGYSLESTQAAPVAGGNSMQSSQSVVMGNKTTTSNGMISIQIGKGENINISFPAGGSNILSSNNGESFENQSGGNSSNGMPAGAENVLRKLTKHFVKVNDVKIGTKTSFKGNVLTIDKKVTELALSKGDLVDSFEFQIIKEKDYKKISNTIMDVQPIATKVEGELGEGVTRVLDGVVLMLTGIDGNGKQIGEFGSSEGEMDRNIMWNRPGAPDKGDIFIKCNIVIKAGAGMERPGPLSAHIAADVIANEIRNVLKDADVEINRTEVFEHKRRPGKPKVIVVKEIMGQGAMHDNLILPIEPVGTVGAVPNVDLGNLPVALSPLEILDGGIHALTCIGPASKETSRHYFREPLVMEALNDSEIDFVGCIIIGSPQVNGEKFYVSKRLGMMVEYMNPDGAIITTEGFGNNHIDFAEHHRSIGKRGVKVVGCAYAAQQGALVVGNEYMYAMIDNNKSKLGIENEILSNNTLCKEDAIRALEMIKAVMANEEVEEAERRWDASVKSTNVQRIEEQKNVKVELLPNEQILEKSKKRREIYEKED